MPGVGWREAQARLAPRHRLAQPKCHGDDAVFRAGRRRWIEVVRPCHARDIRIEPVAVAGAHQALDDHRHGFFFQAVRGGVQERSSALTEGAGVDPFHRVDELGQAHFGMFVVVGQDPGAVNTGQRLLRRILEEAGRSYGQRSPDHGHHPGQRLLDVAGKRRRHDALQGLSLVFGLQSERAQVVIVQELVEDTRAQHHRRRHRESHVREAL